MIILFLSIVCCHLTTIKRMCFIFYGILTIHKGYVAARYRNHSHPGNERRQVFPNVKQA